MSVAAPPELRSPYKGLAPFEDSEQDALFFFGREREREVIVANLQASRLTVLYGSSGVGKTSLLGAGVARELRSLGPKAVVSIQDSWAGSLDGIFDDVRDAEEAYLILDQFEEYFLYHGNDEPGTLLESLPELLRDSRAHVLVSLREDSLAQLDAFKARVPNVFANQVRLEHLDRAAARAAITGPLSRWHELTGESITIEPELVEAVLDEVAVEGRTQDRDRIEAPYLQLVLERIWDGERETGSEVLRVETLRRLGGARTIVRDHLLGALDELTDDEQDVAASVFEHLVTPSGTKIAHRASDLAQYAGVPEDSLRRVLATLSHDRIVHSLDGSDRYEIFHDVLGEPIRTWREQRRVDRERAIARRRHRRLLTLTALAFAALAVVAGLAVWALSERGTAQTRARQARARALDANALIQLTVNPNRGVRLALAAAWLVPGPATESVLRQTLVADRLRLVRHTEDAVTAVAAAPDGKLIAATVKPNRVLLVDARNRRVVRQLVARRAVGEVGFVEQGRRLVAASRQGFAQIWDVATGGEVKPATPVVAARGPQGGLVLVPLRRDLRRAIAHTRLLSATTSGDRIAAAVQEQDGHVRAWLFRADGTRIRSLPGIGINDIAFSPNGLQVATVGATGLTEVWNARTGAPIEALRDAKSGANVVAFSPDSKRLATGGEDSGVRIWTVKSHERTYFLFGHLNPVTSLAWSPDGHVVASGSPDRTVHLWRVDGPGAGSQAAVLAGNGDKINALAFSADGVQLLTGGEDKTVRVWYALPDEVLDLLGRAPGEARAVRWAAGSIVGMWSSGVVKMYDPVSRQPTHSLHSALGQKFTSLGVSSDASVVAAGGARGTTEVWDGRTGTPLTPQSGAAPVTVVAVSPDGTTVASADRRGVLRVWHPRAAGLAWSAQTGRTIADISFSPKGDELVTAGAGGAAIWSTATGRQLHELSSAGADTKAVFSPDGRLVATAGTDTNGRLWYARSGRLYRVLRGHSREVLDVTFSDAGSLVATSGADSDGRIWTVASGVHYPLQRTAFGPVRAIDFDSTGRWVAATGPVSVIIWSVPSARQLFYLRGHTGKLTDVAFAPSGPRLVSSSRDGTLRTYACVVCTDLNGIIHVAEERLARTG